LFQVAFALPQRAQPVGARAFIRPVLDFDAHRTAVAGLAERREKLAPIDIAQSRQLRHGPAETEDALLVKLIMIDAQVLGMDVHDPRAEFADTAGRIDVLE